MYFLKQPFYGNYSTLDSHANTIHCNSVTGLPCRQDGVENRDKVYLRVTCRTKVKKGDVYVSIYLYKMIENH